jgi:hypothetical protein
LIAWAAEALAGGVSFSISRSEAMKLAAKVRACRACSGNSSHSGGAKA